MSRTTSVPILEFATLIVVVVACFVAVVPGIDDSVIAWLDQQQTRDTRKELVQETVALSTTTIQQEWAASRQPEFPSESSSNFDSELFADLEEADRSVEEQITDFDELADDDIPISEVPVEGEIELMGELSLDEPTIANTDMPAVAGVEDRYLNEVDADLPSWDTPDARETVLNVTGEEWIFTNLPDETPLETRQELDLELALKTLSKPLHQIAEDNSPFQVQGALELNEVAIADLPELPIAKPIENSPIEFENFPVLPDEAKSHFESALVIQQPAPQPASRILDFGPNVIKNRYINDTEDNSRGVLSSRVKKSNLSKADRRPMQTRPRPNDNSSVRQREPMTADVMLSGDNQFRR